ncbi:MAG TPA: histidine kinase N-terminal domain-containing protein [Actinomycetota bacterium]
MSVLSALAGRHTTLSDEAVDHLHRLLAEWQLLADLSFADCLLFAPVRDGGSFVVLSQVRPFPAQTIYEEDLVGSIVGAVERPKVATALAEQRIVREGEPDWREGIPIREETVPVIFRGAPIAVIGIEQNVATARTPSHLELAYMRAADDLVRMVAEGAFPFESEEEGEREVSPRVGDGFIQLDADGKVVYASPNAVSAYRRLGITVNLVGERLGEVWEAGRDVVESLRRGRPIENEVEASGAWMLRRFIPVIHDGAVTGAIGLVRDITELRLRDSMLLIKDATIREIHHRVKNNLQTVASLLRLQARRLGDSAARTELEESVRRVTSIALVHETLSQDSTQRADFDRVAQRVLQMVEDSLVRPDRPIRFSLLGSAGSLHSDLATPMSLVLTELIQNAVEHAFIERGGAVVVELKRENGSLFVRVSDDGRGLPKGFNLEGGSHLGLQIVRTLISELRGTITLASDEGTQISLQIPLEKP